MAITDLTNTTWVFNDIITIDDAYSWDINFMSNNTDFGFIKHSVSFSGLLTYLDAEQNATGIYAGSTNKWTNEAYKTITITGGNNVTSSTLILWLQSNATQVTLVNSTTLETTLHTAGKYCDKNILVKSSDSNLTAENIKKDVSIFGVTGTYEGTDVSDTTATQGDVLSGKYFYGSDGVKTEGTMTDHTETSITLNTGTGEQYVPGGHYSDILTKLVLNSDAASKIKQGEVILGVTGTYDGKQTGAGTYEVALTLESAGSKYYIGDYNDTIRNYFYSGELSSIVIGTDNGDITLAIGSSGHGITATYNGVTAGNTDSGVSLSYLTLESLIHITSITVTAGGSIDSTKDYGAEILSVLPSVLRGSNGSVISDWTVGFDLSEKTLTFTDPSGLDELYNIANNYGYGGDDVHLYIEIDSGATTIDCCYGYNQASYVDVNGTKVYNAEDGSYLPFEFGTDMQITGYFFYCGTGTFYDYQAAVDWCVAHMLI